MHLASNAAASRNTRPRTLRYTLKSAALTTCTAAALLASAGCGNTYRPVVSAINPVGPAAQPGKYAIAVASSPNGTPGLMTMVDFSGDTVLVTPNVGIAPYYLALDSTGNTGYTLNGDGTVTSFNISTSLITNAVQQTTLLTGANPVSLLSIGGVTYITEPGRNSVGEFRGSPPALQQELPVASNAVYVVGTSGAPRYYSISQGAAGANGQVAGIETSTNNILTPLTVGQGPVYGVMTADGRRAFILNQGDNTVSVINAQTNALDTFHDPTDPTYLTDPTHARITGTIPVGVAPGWADLIPTKTMLLVANAGNSTSAGSLSLINIPLCTSTALPSNPNCDPANPIDAVGFGQVLANVPVGHSCPQPPNSGPCGPIMVAALQDGTRAYVTNYADSTVWVVNLVSNTVTAKIPVVGRPIYIAATTGTPTGKVYVVSADIIAPNKNSVMTVIRTDIDAVDTTINLQGIGVSVRVTQP